MSNFKPGNLIECIGYALKMDFQTLTKEEDPNKNVTKPVPNLQDVSFIPGDIAVVVQIVQELNLMEVLFEGIIYTTILNPKKNCWKKIG